MKSLLWRGTAASLFLLVSMPLRAGFASNQVFLPAVGRVAGSGGAQFFTTVWATNLGSVPVTFEFAFLRQGQANAAPASFTDSLAPGQTKVYENVIETRLGLASAIGAARITATGDLLVAERIFNQAPGADLGDTEGLFFAAVPGSFSINLGQSASIQGLNQGGSENFRYNFALVETAGATTKVNVQVLDENGSQLGQKAFTLEPFEQLQPNVAEVVPGFSSINARITATVVDGAGSILLAGAQLANVSQDSSGFEMSFPGELIGAGGGTGVTSVNGITGAVSIAAGNGIAITRSGSSINIASTVGGGLTLPFNGSTNTTQPAFEVLNNNVSGPAIVGVNSGGTGAGVVGGSGLGSSVPAPAAGVRGDSNGSIGVAGTSGNSVAVLGSSSANDGVQGLTDSTASGIAGVFGLDGSGEAGIAGGPSASSGVRGESLSHFGVIGLSGTTAGVFGQVGSSLINVAGVQGVDGSGSTALGAASAGVRGDSNSGVGVVGLSTTGLGILGATASGVSGIRGATFSAANDHSGVIGFDGSFAGITGVLSAGVRGESGTNIGVVGLSKNFGVVGRLPSGVQGELGSHRSGSDFALFTFGNASINGTFTATGTKSFVEPHPTDPTREIRFACLEGPESGTYFRGHGRIAGGFAKIDVPESFRDVSDENGLTVVATAVGGPGSIWVMKKSLDQILLQANSDVEFDYMVNGVRKAYRNFEAIAENRDFVPDGPDDRRFALYAPELQKRLVATGIYNADGTVNRETAKRLGWDRGWKESAAR